MLKKLRASISTAGVHGGHTIVALGGLVFVAAGVYLTIYQHDDAYAVLTKSLVAAGLTMVVVGVAERFWSGRKIKQAGVSPEGAEVTFEDQISTAVSEVNERLNEHTQVINERLYDLEKTVFKETGPEE